MIRKVYVTLRAGKRTRRVPVESLTLERYLRLVQMVSHRASVASMKQKEPLEGYEWLARMTAADINAVAECAAPSLPPRWFNDTWASTDNLWRLIGGLLDTNDAEKLMRALTLNGKEREGGGSFEGDVHLICQQFPGLTPPMVRQWYADEYLDTCAGIRAVLGMSEKKKERDSTPCHTAAMIGIPGVEIVTN